MTEIDRRSFVASLAMTGASIVAGSAEAQQQPAAPPAPAKFSFDDVVRRARELASAPLTPAPALPEALARLDYDAWRDIRFRPERALFTSSNGAFRLQTFHLGHLYRRPVTVNTIRDGIATPIPYAPNMFDYGRTKFEKPLPVNLGFAGFRLHYPLNDPRSFDEVISFLGGSYFRFLGRGQHYGMSARGLAVNPGSEQEEIPFFREFWVESPGPQADSITIYALLDGESATGAYRFDLRPGTNSALEVKMTLFARKPGVSFGIAPVTSMFLVGENDRRVPTDFRSEKHDSDGLLLNSATGEWLWRPLRNPASREVSTFLGKDLRGFGLIQRDRDFDHYQDLDLDYELRPSYFVEPTASWGEGHLELVELPATNDNTDNIVVSWVPQDPLEPGKPASFAYRITASLENTRISPNGQAVATYQAQVLAPGTQAATPAGSRRLIIDFAGGDLPYYLTDPAAVEVVASTTNGRILGSSSTPNPHSKGFRVSLDIQLDPGQTTDLRAFLRSGGRALTEPWTMPWKAA